MPFDPSAPPPAEVPWLVRRDIGSARAYWRTVSMVLRHPRQFAKQAHWTGTGDAGDAETFRKITVAIATLSFALAGGLLRLYDPRLPLADAARAGAVTAAMALGPLLAFFWIATLPAPVDLYSPRTWDIVNRFRHLQRFTCAGLACAPAIPFALALAVAAFHVGERGAAAQLMAIAAATAAAVTLAWLAGGAMYVALAGKPGLAQSLEAFTCWCILIFAAVVAAAGTGLLLRHALRTVRALAQ